MNESFIKTVLGLFLAHGLASSPDNINELSSQNAIHDTYQLLGLNSRVNPSCLNKKSDLAYLPEQDAEALMNVAMSWWVNSY